MEDTPVPIDVNVSIIAARDRKQAIEILRYIAQKLDDGEELGYWDKFEGVRFVTSAHLNQKFIAVKWAERLRSTKGKIDRAEADEMVEEQLSKEEFEAGESVNFVYLMYCKLLRMDEAVKAVWEILGVKPSEATTPLHFDEVDALSIEFKLKDESYTVSLGTIAGWNENEEDENVDACWDPNAVDYVLSKHHEYDSVEAELDSIDNDLPSTVNLFVGSSIIDLRKALIVLKNE